LGVLTVGLPTLYLKLLIQNSEFETKLKYKKQAAVQLSPFMYRLESLLKSLHLSIHEINCILHHHYRWKLYSTRNISMEEDQGMSIPLVLPTWQTVCRTSGHFWNLAFFLF